jgi:hypothetical protein
VLGPHLAQRSEIPADRPLTSVWKHDDAPESREVPQQLAGPGIGEREIDGGMWQQFVNALDQRSQENRVAQSPVDSADQDAGDALNRKLGTKFPPAHEPGEGAAQPQARIAAAMAQPPAQVRSSSSQAIEKWFEHVQDERISGTGTQSIANERIAKGI